MNPERTQSMLPPGIIFQLPLWSFHFIRLLGEWFWLIQPTYKVNLFIHIYLSTSRVSSLYRFSSAC
jgi:hypothetical protein